MRIYHSIGEVRNISNAIVTIGTFDGVHIGHRAILDKMVSEAKSAGCPAVVITFHPHPRQILNADAANLRFISTQNQKIKRLEEIGIDNLIILPFTHEFSRTPSEQFIKNYIVDHLHPSKLIVGYDHHFGKNRLGDYSQLVVLGKMYGFDVEKIDIQVWENLAVSSTKIRNALRQGDVGYANSLLGYPYTLEGEVVEGNKIGRTIGFPTANINISPEFQIIEVAGVYACRVLVDGEQFNGMANIGLRPTVEERDSFILEVNIFDFNRDIYHHNVGVQLIERIRGEVKYSGLEQLKNQLCRDRQQATDILK